MNELSTDVEFNQTQRTNHDSTDSRTSISNLDETFFAKIKIRIIELMQ